MSTNTMLRAIAMPRGQRLTAVKVVGFAVALALAAQIAIPLPGTPVPFTLQPLVVVLAGFWLGPVAAVASMTTYLLAGAVGLPVWAPLGAPGVARLVGPTGGYLLAYPLAAWVASVLVRRAGSVGGRIAAAIAAMAVIYAGGLAQLAVLTGSVTVAALLGAAPFAGLDLVKCVIAAILAPKRLSEAR
ncbi:MAG TPA: biotin transporter BioY [Gemmatimonadaceae bacterium]|nr:biotin transporter BioY [Gemmatimonadaceae bacterium]